LHLWLVFVPVGAFRILANARLPRLRHQVHQTLASGVLAIDQLQHIGEEAELGRQSERECRCLGAAVTLGRNNWKAVERMQLVFFDGALERVVVRDRGPVWIYRGFEPFRWNWIAGAPQLHWAAVDGKRYPQNFSRRISGIASCTNLLQIDLRPRLEIAVQGMRGLGLHGCGIQQWLMLHHSSAPKVAA